MPIKTAEGNEGNDVQSSFDRAKGAMAKVLEAYQNAKETDGGLSPVDLYEFPPMMRIVKAMERENLEGVLRGEELKKIEETQEFAALAQSTAGARAIKRSHIYGVRIAVLEEMEREGKDVGKLKQELLRSIRDNPDA